MAAKSYLLGKGTSLHKNCIFKANYTSVTPIVETLYLV